jgi:hypothetical protein
MKERRNETSHNLASIVATILKRDGRDVLDMSAIDRLAELHAAERQLDEAVNNYETAVLREHRMQEQRDRLAEALERLKKLPEKWRNECSGNWLRGGVVLQLADDFEAAVKGESHE